jgi:DNA repair protein RadA/Sms
MVIFGEIGLGGEVRAVSQREARLKEAAKLGFKSAIVPAAARGAKPGAGGGIRVDEIEHLNDLVARLRPPGTVSRTASRRPGRQSEMG